MMDGRVLIDASVYMLFEASGDSESQCIDGVFDLDSDAATAAEDDAQSCSYGSECESARLRDVVDDGGDDFRGVDFDAGWSEVEDNDGGEEDGVVNQCRSRWTAAATEKPVKSKGCEDSKANLMNERDGDRQFWEACLAS